MNRPITDAVSAFRMPRELYSPRRSIREGERTYKFKGLAIEVNARPNRYRALLISSKVQKRKRNDSHGSEAENTLSKLEQEEVHVEGVIRQTIRKVSLVLSEDINDLALVDINSYMDTLSRLVRALVALQSTE
ncbi:MAG: hypothetical protein M1818_002693 [Claussenomyces sp. TS43310]|nr:MAG: hypothetical protein M1818_002693 [Claussenomyces sp. TS43310]